jgi:recombination protein RecA
MYDSGISREGDLLDLAIDDKIVEKSGAWVNYGDMRLGQGRENAKQYLRDNPQLLEEISRKVLAKRLKSSAPAVEPATKAETPPAKRSEAPAAQKKGPAKAEA